MGASVNNIPSINVPLTDREGRINPIWHEFLRKFITKAIENTEDDDATATNITAGAGLIGGGSISNDVTLAVGAGSGITVNANDVNVDINNQFQIQASLDDELLISDKSDNNSIRKTTVRDISSLTSPGGISSQVQYNNNGIFAGDSGFTTDGSGSVNISGDLDVDNINLNGSTITNTSSSPLALETSGILNYTAVRNTGDATRFKVQSEGGVAATIYLVSDYLNAGGKANPAVYFGEGTTEDRFSLSYSTLVGDRRLNALASSTVGWSIDTSGNARFPQHLTRHVTDNITASTTQTQGQGALTTDINVITTVANTNDTVTLPSAYSTNTYIGGQRVTVINDGANTLKIYPAGGQSLGLGTNVATTIPAGTTAEFISKNNATWKMINSSGGTGTFYRSVTASITASTTQTQGQGALTSDINEVSNCANANDTVTLPAALPGRYCLVINNGANTLQVFPASGDNLGVGVDTSTTINSGSRKMFIAFDSTNWEPVI